MHGNPEISTRIAAMMFAMLLPFAEGQAQGSGPVQFIDTQAQFDPFVPAHRFKEIVPHIVEEMDRFGVSKTFIVPPPFPEHMPRNMLYDAEQIVAAIKGNPRFAYLAGGGSLNQMILGISPGNVSESDKKKFRERALEILRLGALGFGEVTAHHLSVPIMGQHHVFLVTAPDHPLLLLLADIAAEHDVPIDIHLDAIPADMALPEFLAGQQLNPRNLQENVTAFERLLAHNRKAKFVWSHTGSDPPMRRTVGLIRQLLDKHVNLYTSIRIVRAARAPVFPLDESGKLKDEWMKLLSDHRDRFFLQSDVFYQMPPPLIGRGPRESLALARHLLTQLPDDVARMIAHENARRVYKLKD